MSEGPGGGRGRGERDDAEREAPRGRFHPGDGARAVLAAALVAALGAACDGALSATAGDPHSRPIGRGAAYHPGPGARAVHGLACRRGGRGRFGVHLELFAHRLVVLVPAGIGVGAPRVRRGAYVVAGRCSYPARTVEPTGVVQVEPGPRITLGELFALWGRPLDGNRLLSFRGPVRAFVGGRRWRGDPRAIPLTRHAEIALEVAGFVPPRLGYRFRPGL